MKDQLRQLLNKPFVAVPTYASVARDSDDVRFKKTTTIIAALAASLSLPSRR